MAKEIRLSEQQYQIVQAVRSIGQATAKAAGQKLVI
jgi:hypothetical protein